MVIQVEHLTLELTRGDVTEADTDVIVNAANSLLMGGGGVDGAIHRAAGPQLMDALRELKRALPGGVLETGGAVITPGFRLKASWVIHCAGPIYDREGAEAPALLASCYQRSVALARDHGARSVAFCSISTGVYGYPVREAAPVALAAVRDAVLASSEPLSCRFVLFDQATLDAYRVAADSLLG